MNLPAPNPLFQQARERQADRIRKGTDTLGPKATQAQRLDYLEHILSIAMLSKEVSGIFAQIDKGSRDILETEKLSAVAALRGAELSKAALALSDAEAGSLTSYLTAEHFVGLDAEPREWLMSLLHPSKAAEFTFELLPLVDVEHVRVTRIVRGRDASIAITPKAEAPEATDSVFVEPLPEAVSRASALAAWKRSGSGLPELR